MAYDYQGLVNDVLLELNEEELSSSSDFNSAVGFHKFVKSAINWSINELHRQEDWCWPFNKTTGTVTCVAGQGALDNPYTLATAASYDWNSFYITYNGSLTTSKDQSKLSDINLSTYRDLYFDNDINNNNLATPKRGKPGFVVRATDNKLILSPIPDQAYIIKYDYFAYNTQLSAYNDIISIPESYRHIITTGALIRCYAFRSDETMHQFAKKDFEDYINDMRRALIPQEKALRPIGI